MALLKGGMLDFSFCSEATEEIVAELVMAEVEPGIMNTPLKGNRLKTSRQHALRRLEKD